jgi:ParB family transcriptional regulator, chromosome partitioning protein
MKSSSKITDQISLFEDFPDQSETVSGSKKSVSTGLVLDYQAGKYYEVDINLITVSPMVKLREIPPMKMAALVASINTVGILNPLLCIIKEDQLILVAGQQRFAAAKLLKLESVPVRTIKGDHVQLAAHENLIRQNLTLIEEAELMQLIKGKKKSRHEELAKTYAISLENVVRLLSVASLPQNIRDELRSDVDLSMGFVLELTHETSEKGQLAKLDEYKILHGNRAGKRRKSRSRK